MGLQEFQVFDQDLSAAATAAYLSCDRLAVDTETMGLRHHRDRLCLVQISNGEGQISVVRIEQGQTSAPQLQQLMESPAVEKIFHFARFDMAALRHHLGIVTQPVFCTKIASKLVRTYSSRHGLKELVREMTGIELDKSAQSSDWGNARALSDEQLSYASNDVRYLIAVQDQLKGMLHREQRLSLAQSCFECLPTLVTLDLMHFENIFEH
ncbi:ribonuclease D [Lyngbya confervoides]|uniref:Ribonuclease D n=1 Tax=Lyngbya confervoides BDU141951 TaxID=1574623 RepID=A0ABD4T487_9CYAN|nr:ribonuclease D [Lyngbya confervoides]MCM1983399.1 ribonuclease D [Lyngbya confervoides BDU141951]